MAWLSRFVANMRITEPTGTQPITRLPDGYTSLIFRLHDDRRTGDLTISGPRTRAHFKVMNGIARSIAIQLKPGWAMQLLGAPASAFTDRFVPLHDIWGRAGHELCEQLITSSEPLDLISHAIAARAIDEPASARLARRAVRMLETEDVPINVVAERLGVTPRHLRRAFTESVGIGPKDFARTVRLQRVLDLATRSTDWGRIAADSGYFDQAHLITDFRQLVGLTPGAYVKRTALAPRANQ
jgi:AraC-like DNA-binding protein